MTDALFEEVDQLLDTAGSAAALDYLVQQFRESKRFPLLFEARLMRKRLELGLPLVQTQSTEALPEALRKNYEQEMIEAAREVGALFLAQGNIPRAWPYFRAIGEVEPVKRAVAAVEPQSEHIEEIIAIAFQEGLHPVKGLELILGQYGMCRAITSFGMYAVPEGREECLHLLTSSLHAELKANIARAIEAHEGAAPAEGSIPGLLADRPWLFGEYDYYIDSSHLSSVLQYTPEVTRPDTLALIRELCAYGKRLSSQFRFQTQPPFDDLYRDYDTYAAAVLGEDVDAAIAHFLEKVRAADREEIGPGPAEVLVKLLVRLERYPQALAVSLEHLAEWPASESGCPTALQLCHLAGDYEQLRSLARAKGDVLSYTAATARITTGVGGM